MCTGLSAPVRAARPLIDSGKWDAYFALFARDTQVPWKHVSVRLDTYSGAPVDFAAYEVDPADVLIAGAGARSRAIDLSRRTAVAKWRFTPPAGLRFESNDVDVPLANREGFFVIEARRGDASQQVWMNLSRIGILTKEAPGGMLLYAADLGTGRALSGMRLSYLVGAAFVYAKTDANGVAHVPAGQRPRFALAEWGHSRAAVNFLPVSPLPNAVVGVRLETGAVRAGNRVRAVGFARKKTGNAMRPATGEVNVTVVARGRTLATATPKLDSAGAFSAELAIPADAPAGDFAVLASSSGATGGATLRIDATGDATLAIDVPCAVACAPDAQVPVVVSAKSSGAPLAGREMRVRVVRTPHVLAPGTLDDAEPWATTVIFDHTLRADDLGLVRVTLPAPTDGLASTYGIKAESGTATASVRVVTPTARIALAVTPQRSTVDIGEASVVDVRGFDALAGTPAAGTSVHVALTHGPIVQEENVKLDADGRARVTFRNVVPGTSLVTADADVDGKHAFDAASVTASPSVGASGGGSGGSDDVKMTLDKERYHVGDRTVVTASLSGAAGNAFFSIEGARPFATQTVNVNGGSATGTMTIPETIGDAYVGVAFVRDGEMFYGTQRVVVDGPGHERAVTLGADKTVYAPGETAHISVTDGAPHGAATIALRLGDARPSRSAAFDNAPGVLSAAATSSQNPASDDPAWHAWVTPARSTVGDIFGVDRPAQTEQIDNSIVAAAPHALLWRIERIDGPNIAVVLPPQKGTYVLSLLKMSDDGDVGAATLSLTVQ
jgi:uncharacterized protein YfaS (alpha-2-macroglobulin family)